MSVRFGGRERDTSASEETDHRSNDSGGDRGKTNEDDKENEEGVRLVQ